MPLQCFEHRAKRGGKRNGFSKAAIFPLLFLNQFLNLALADLSLMIRWARFPFFFWALGLADGFLAISFHVLSTVGYWACWVLDLWWITEVLDLVYRGPKKWASTFSPPSPCLTWCEVRVSSVTQSADHKVLIGLCIRRPLLLLSLRLLN